MITDSDALSVSTILFGKTDAQNMTKSIWQTSRAVLVASAASNETTERSKLVVLQNISFCTLVTKSNMEPKSGSPLPASVSRATLDSRACEETVNSFLQDLTQVVVYKSKKVEKKQRCHRTLHPILSRAVGQTVFNRVLNKSVFVGQQIAKFNIAILKHDKSVRGKLAGQENYNLFQAQTSARVPENLQFQPGHWETYQHHQMPMGRLVGYGHFSPGHSNYTQNKKRRIILNYIRARMKFTVHARHWPYPRPNRPAPTLYTYFSQKCTCTTVQRARNPHWAWLSPGNDLKHHPLII